MGPWLETVGVLILAFLGFLLGLRASRLRKPYWGIGYAVPLLFLIALGLVRNIGRLRFVGAVSWVAAGRNEFVILSAAVPMLFGTLIPRLKKKRLKVLVVILMAAAAGHFVILAFLVPGLVRGRLAELDTVINADDVCLQTTKYTCGPASAVSALRRLGIEAEEGELAILAHSTPVHGTADDLLCRAIEKQYGPQGVRCRYRYFDSIDQLRGTCPTIAVIRYAILVDHYVTVTEVEDDFVVTADPLGGIQKLTHEEFADKWRFVGIVVERSSEAESGNVEP
jgi:predicted double-glycine peptidase